MHPVSRFFLRGILIATVFLTPGRLAAAESTTATATVDALVAEVLASNPELKFYVAEIAAAKGGQRAAATRANPELAAEIGNKRVRQPAGVTGDGAAWSVSVQQTFEYPGRIALRKAIANRQVDLAELGLAQFRATLATRARTLVYAIYVAQQKFLVAREVADRFHALQEVALQRDPAGLTPLLEARILEANALILQRRVTTASLESDTALVELNQLRVQPLRTPVRVARFDAQLGPAPDLDAMLAAARTHAFELRMRQVELAQQGFKVDLAKNERYGAFTVSPYYSEARAGDHERQVGIGVSMPLPLWNRNTGNIDTAGARLQQAETSLLVMQRQIERQVTAAALIYEARLAEIARWRPAAPEDFRAAAEAADQHYRLGAVPIATYVELQKQYLDATEALLETRREAFDAGQQLELLTGLNLQHRGAGAGTPQP